MNTKALASEIVNELQARGLAVVPVAGLKKFKPGGHETVREKQRRLLRKKALTLKEIVDACFFPDITTKQALAYWVETGKIREDETFILSNDGKRYVMTLAVRRLLKIKGYDDSNL